MLERTYRERLDADLTRWETAGLITPATRDAMVRALPPLPAGINVATVVAIVGGLLIAAAFLAFIAANWTEIARPLRFLILLAGIATSFGLGAWFDRTGHTIIADLAASVGAIIFGAAIALVGQMYHLGGEFADGMFLWAAGALTAALLTSSRGTLAVALVVGCIWSGMRVYDDDAAPHLAFVAFWFISAGLAIAWNAPVARHLTALAAVVWWILTGLGVLHGSYLTDPSVIIAAGACLMLGVGLALAPRGPATLRAFGLTLSTYAAFAVAIALAWTVSAILHGFPRPLPEWAMICAAVGILLAFIGAFIGMRAGPAFAGLAALLAFGVVSGWARLGTSGEPWLAYALALASMLSLVISGLLDGVRPRIVAGWLGLAAVIAGITWAVKGSLLRRAVFLAAAGCVAIVAAIGLARVFPREERR